LLAGEKRVATGADFHVDIALVGRPRGKAAAACAEHANFVVCRMNGCFHGFSKLILNHLILKDRYRIQQTGRTYLRENSTETVVCTLTGCPLRINGV
jgi:hypothetical protein